MPRGRPKGIPKTGGRKPGSPNRVTVEVRAAAAALVDDPTYRARLLDDLRKRKLAPAVETMLWYYAKGKPKETVALEDNTTDPKWVKSPQARAAAEELLASVARGDAPKR